jgi:putative nucleotidyltransferase with HDIG domain
MLHPGGTQLFDRLDIKKLAAVKTMADIFTGSNECFLVGGAVRDLVMHRPVNDLDFATNLPPDAVQLLLTRYGLPAILTGAEYGTVMTVIEDEKVEITTYRKEVYPTDSRKPVVEFGAELYDDLARRDFTINAMALDVHDGEKLIDPFFGRKDIKSRYIRPVGNVEDRFNEDPLRVLRAIRFTAVLGFDFNGAIISYILSDQAALRLSIVSRERIAVELDKILCADFSHIGLRYLVLSHLFDDMLPEFRSMLGFEQPKEWHEFDVFHHTVRTVDHVESISVMRWAALLHDIGKPRAAKFSEERGRLVFHGHQEVSEKIARRFMTELKMSNAIIDEVCEIIHYHMAAHSMAETHAAVRRFVHKLKYTDPRSVIKFGIADAIASGKPIVDRMLHYNQLLHILADIEVDHPQGVTCPISGEEIMEKFHLVPGPDVGIIKAAVVDAIVDGVVKFDDMPAVWAIAFGAMGALSEQRR